MKTLIAIIVLAALLQTTIVPLNLVLLILISRSLIRPEKNNLTLAFLSGVLIAYLTSTNLGFYPLVYLILVQLTHLIDNSPLSKNHLTIVPLSLFIFVVVGYLERLFLHQSFNMVVVIVEAVISLPIYIAVRFWEERFIPTPSVRLKLR